jgi:chemotaxis protein MotB
MRDEDAIQLEPVGSRRGFPFKMLFITILAVGAAGGIGYYAWNLRTDHMATQGDLKAARVEASQAAEAKQKNVELGEQLAVQKQRCDAIETSVQEMQGNLSATRAELDTLRKQREETAKRLGAFKDLTKKFQKMIDSGKLDVIVRDGRMIVKLPAGVLFDSGSAELSRDGELALMEVAIVLRQFGDRQFMIAGHTDDRPLESAQATTKYRNNWELSAARALTVTEFLIEARMKPENLVAAGYGQFDPVGNNKTSQGRQDNRRIEIVLLPNIEEMPEMPEPPPDDSAANKE